MKKTLKSILCFVLTVAMLVVTLNVAIQADTATVKNYYVKNGGTGDGRTEQNPAATVSKVIESVNADNLTVGDTANIYVMQRTDWASCDANSAHGMTYWADENGGNYSWHCKVPKHTAQIVVQPYATTGTTYLAYSKYLGDAWGLCINGPTTFKGLTIVLTKGTTNARIDANGNNLTFESDVVFARYDGNAKLTSWDGSGIVTNDRPIITSGVNENGAHTIAEDVNITLHNAYKPSGDYYGLNYALYVSNSNYTNFTYQKDVNLNFTNSESQPKVALGDNKADGATTINGSLNINAKNAAALTLIAGKGSLNTNAIQIITGANTTYSGDISTFANVTANNVWHIKDTTENGVFSLTDTPGTYKISEGAKITAINNEGKKFYPVNNTLTLPAGEYTINTPTVKNYYVKNGGTGDGRTEQNPAATVSKVIESVNADNLTVGDTANIYVMQRTDWASCDANSAHGMTYWADENGGNYSWHCKVPKHTAQIVVQPYATTGTTYLAYSKYLGDAWGLCINGPTTFKGLTIVLTKGTTNARIDANGNNLTFESDVVFARYDGNAKLTSWDGSGIVTNDRPIITSGVNENGAHTIAEDVNITLHNAYKPSGDYYGLNYALYVSNSNYTNFTYQKDVNLNFTNSESQPKVALGDNKADGATTINGSLNINAKNAAALTLIAGKGSLNTNAIQIITGANTTYSGDISTFANVTANNVWYIKDSNKGTVSFSDIAGTFNINSDYKYAYAYDAVNNPTTVYYGENTLTLPEGNYTIGYTDDLNNLNITVDMEGFLEWQNNNNGTLTAVIISPDQPLETYKNYINYRTDLKNTYNKLTTGDKNLNVVYFGGSVTVGTGASDRDKYSWRALIGQWLKTNFPQANINNINTGAGESGTYLGSFRVERDVISQKPDLLFIEYSINDKYANASYETAQLQYETIVRKVREALPKCDIVTILVTDQNEAAAARADKGGVLHTQALAHEDMAKIYNIPTICVGKALADALPSASFTTDDWRVYVTDPVHPNDNGYKLYYNVIREFMYNNLIYNDYDDTTITNHTMPSLQSEKLLDGNITAIEITQEVFNRSVALGGQGFTRDGNATAINGTYHGGVYAQKTNTNAEFILEFTGTELAAFVNCYSPTQYMVKIDDGDYVTKTFAGHNPTIIAEGLISGEHTVYIKPIMSSLPSNTSAVWINMFFTRDAAYQTCKTYSNYGDINLDGKINVLDLVKADEKLTDKNLCHPADINKDGKVDLTDLKFLKQHIIGKYQIV